MHTSSNITHLAFLTLCQGIDCKQHTHGIANITDNMLTEKTQLEYINYGNIQKYINQDLLMAIMGLPTVINSIQ